MPVDELDKPANCRCQHQRTGKGCAIYRDRPMSCQLWSCRWLVDDDCAQLPRPDRSHYVVDMIPDFVTMQPNDGGPSQHIPVIQVWCDPAFPDAHKAPSFRAWLDRQGTCALIRYNSRDAFVLAPPSLTGGEWHEQRGNSTEKTHTLQEKAAALGATLRIEVSNGESVGRANFDLDGKSTPIAFIGRRP